VYNDRTQTWEADRLSRFVDVSTLAQIHIQVTVVSVDLGISLTITLLDEVGTVKASVSRSFDAPGNYVLAFSRTDWNELTEVEAQLYADGRMGMDVILYAIGEDVPEWP
jgi:hypothetical protein